MHGSYKCSPVPESINVPYAELFFCFDLYFQMCCSYFNKTIILSCFLWPTNMTMFLYYIGFYHFYMKIDLKENKNPLCLSHLNHWIINKAYQCKKPTSHTSAKLWERERFISPSWCGWNSKSPDGSYLFRKGNTDHENSLCLSPDFHAFVCSSEQSLWLEAGPLLAFHTRWGHTPLPPAN